METNKVLIDIIYDKDVKGNYTRVHLAPDTFNLITFKKGEQPAVKADKGQEESEGWVNIYNTGFDIPFITVTSDDISRKTRVYVLTSDLTEDRIVARPSILPEGF